MNVQPFAIAKTLGDLEVLATNSLLAKLTIQELGVFAERLDQMALTRGTSLLREGSEGDAMYFVLDGHARVERRGIELRALGPGDHFGELALIGSSRAPATIEATTAIRLARLSR